MVCLNKPLNPEADPWAPTPVPAHQKPSIPSPAPVTRLLPVRPLLPSNPHYKLINPYPYSLFSGCQTIFFYNFQQQPPPLPLPLPLPLSLPLPRLTEAQSPLPTTAVKTSRVSKRLSRGRGAGQRSVTPRKSSVWLPKNIKSYDKFAGCARSSSHRPSPSPPSPENVLPLCDKTTVMVKNIPNQFRRNMLLSFLDKLCHEQNQKAELESSPIRFEYDFLYLPMDFWRGDNLGYAFVNFTSAEAAERIQDLLQDYKWGVFKDSCGSLRGSKKVCEITWARIQGKEELVRHFRNSNFACRNTEYLPVVFSPPRDGSSSSLPMTIGRCLASL